MPIRDYGVWAGYVIDYDAERAKDDPKSPHIHLKYSNTPDPSDEQFTAAINVKSVSKDSRLAFWSIQNYDHPVTQFLESLPNGFQALPSQERHGLDFIRGNLFDIDRGMLVEHDLPGSNNDILDYVTPTLDRAKEEGSKVYLFGQQFDDQTGIHDIHMNQGNEGSFKRDNGVFQDGALLLKFPDGRFTAIFIAFAIQKVHTDDVTGDPITNIDFAHYLAQSGGVVADVPEANDGIVIIKSALVNPASDNVDAQETVRLYNRSRNVVKIDGWSIVNGNGDKQTLEGVLQPFQEKGIMVTDCPLSNRGDTITLLDSAGLKVDGVRYTAKQARREGRFLIFHS